MTKKPKHFNPFWTNFFSKHHLDEDYKNKIYQFYEKDIQIDGKRIIGTTFFNEKFSESEKLQEIEKVVNYIVSYTTKILIKEYNKK